MEVRRVMHECGSADQSEGLLSVCLCLTLSQNSSFETVLSQPDVA